MIYYYSGTGNTRYCAGEMARLLGEPVHFIFGAGETPLPADGETAGFMFPIYSWGVPPAVTEFIDRFPPEALQGRYVWGCCTCGDEAGIAMRLFSRQIKRLRGAAPQALFSVIMPNDYVLLPGFDVDRPDIMESKLKAVPGRLAGIAAAIKRRQRAVFDVKEGSFPALRTRLVFPLFKRWGVNPRKWIAGDGCIGCGKCANACPAGNITMLAVKSAQGLRPEWGSNCLSCCACFHICPQRAIDYGKATRTKGQYYFGIRR